MDEETKKILLDYVKDQKINSAGTKKLKAFCERQPPITKTVFRGHKRSREIRFNANWYSATELMKVAKEEFASAACCVFTIHLIDIPIIDVNQFVGDDIGHYKEEKEIIFLGGGSFYKDKDRNEHGFIEKASGEFECWYVFDKEESASSPRKTSKEKTIFGLIPEDEYEFIDSPEDIVFPGHRLTVAQKQAVFLMIQKKQGVVDSDAGKKRITRAKTRRTRKRPTKKSRKKISRKQKKKRHKKSSKK